GFRTGQGYAGGQMGGGSRGSHERGHGCKRGEPYESRDSFGDRRLYVAGTGTSQRVGRTNRSVFIWSSALRDGNRDAAVPWRKLGSYLQGHSGRNSDLHSTAESGCATQAGR